MGRPHAHHDADRGAIGVWGARRTLNYVLIDVRDYEGAIAEIARVLKPGGRFVYTLLHHTSDGAWHRPAPDSPRREERAGWLIDRYFERRAVYSKWGDLHPCSAFTVRCVITWLPARATGWSCATWRSRSSPQKGGGCCRLHRRAAQRPSISYVLKTVKAAQAVQPVD